MRSFLVTILALFIASLPILGFIAGYYYLELACSSIGISSFFPYFILGALMGRYWKNIKSFYTNYWLAVWDAAKDKLL